MERLKEVQREQSKRRSGGAGGSMAELIDPLNCMSASSDAAKMRKDREVLSLIVKEINFSKEKRLFNRYIDDKNTDMYLRQLKHTPAPFKSVDAR